MDGAAQCSTHTTEADARDEAAYLLDDYMARGWTETIYRDPRLN
jgi:hypothetical protein